MKKIIALCLCFLLFIFCFSGCAYSLSDIPYFRTENVYKRFAENHEVGMTKQEIFDKLGCPVSYVDSQGAHGIDSESREKFETNIFSKDSVTWIYTCDAYPASSGSYKLTINFDTEGKSTYVWIIGIN